jgi:ligand-binding sensor domain-containing protein
MNMRLNLSQHFAIVLIACIIGNIQSFAADQLMAFNNTRNVRDIVSVGNEIWCATSGGLVGFNSEDESFVNFNHLDGIEGTAIDMLTLNSDGNIWMVVERRNLQLFNTQEHMVMQTVFSGSEVSSINDVAISESGVYLATNIGIGRVKYFPELDEWFWFEQYTKLGSFPLQEPATCVAIKDGRIWVGTAMGVASAELNDHIPLTWTNYTTSNGLVSNNVFDIEIIDDNIYFSTVGGISIWIDNSWNKIGVPSGLKKLYNGNGILHAVAYQGIFNWNGITWRRISSEHKWLSSMTIDDDSSVWAGLKQNDFSAGGIAVANDTGWVEYTDDSPISNVTRDIEISGNGVVLLVGGIGTGGDYGISIWNGSNWRCWHRPISNKRIFGYPHRSLAVDFDGGFWFGTHGGGLGYIKLQSDGMLDTLILYDHSVASGQRLIGYDYGDNVYNVLAPAVEKDAQGNIWVVNRGAANGNVLVCIPRSYIQSPDTSSWRYYNHSNFGNFTDMDLLAIDGMNRKWLASTATSGLRGVYVFDDNGTLDDKNDDRSWGPISGLKQPQANCIKWDPDGYIWIGAIDGAYYINANSVNPGNEAFSAYYNTRDESVNAIEIDVEGNKWLGTNHGILLVGRDLFTIVERISTDPPYMLPDSTITTIEIDSQSGWAYVGTTNGAIGMRTPYRDYGEKIEDVSVVPNPFNPNLSLMYFTEGLANNADVRIYTPDGRLVRKLSNREAGQGWDGLNDDGRKVADGVYLLMTYNSKGQAGQGKVAVVWK